MSEDVAVMTTDGLKKLIHSQYQKQIENYFGDSKKAMRFLSGVIAATQRNPKLLECTPTSLINSFMTMAQLQLMPSDVSGEAYVLPYNNSKNVGGKWVPVMEAQFQLGYKGLVTLFYRAGIRKIVGELVRVKDEFTYINGEINHQVDPFAERGARRGAYVIVTLGNGEKLSKVMNKDEILGIAKKFSKSYDVKKKDGTKAKTPWDEAEDPQGWMWIKTVLKQIAKLVPKNDAIIDAIAKDNADSNINDRLDEGKELAAGATMGALVAAADKPNDTTDATQEPHDGQETGDQGESKETGEEQIGKDIVV